MNPSAYHLSRRAFCNLIAVSAFAGLVKAQEANAVTFAQLYETGPQALKLSAKLESLRGQPVTMRGYMAPPLKPESNFFVLTRLPMSVCPFCSSGAEWPADIVVVYLSQSAQAMSPSQLIHVAGTLEIGLKMDQDTGFVSLIRIIEAQWQTV